MSEKGCVVLVGAGCCEAHMTLGGLKWIKKADVIIYDALIDSSVLQYAKDCCEKIYAGKRAGKHGMKQDEINALIYEKAASGALVVRLKGGDGFVFGRGGEEIVYLEERGIACTIVPGISSSIAVPESLGIPVTHRGAASSFCVVTAHEAAGDREDYAQLASFGGTLVFMMGGAKIPDIASRLIACGKDADMPAAILSKGCTTGQSRKDLVLRELAQLREEIETPAILVVGAVAALTLPSTAEKTPQVTVTGTKSFTDRVSEAFENERIQAKKLMTLSVKPMTEKIPANPEAYRWLVFTGANGVDVYFKYLHDTGTDLRSLGHVRFACVGQGTALRLKEYGFTADYVPDDHCVKALGAGLARRVAAGERVLILRSKKGSDELCKALDASGIPYDDIRTYDTAYVPAARPDRGYVVFGSGEGVRAYFASEADEGNVRYVCIGEPTAAVLKEYTSKTYIVSGSQSAEEIVRAVAEDYKTHND